MGNVGEQDAFARHRHARRVRCAHRGKSKAERPHLRLFTCWYISSAAFTTFEFANVAIYEFGAKRKVEGLAPNAPMPAPAKIAGALSLGLWVAVAACGRSIAYF